MEKTGEVMENNSMDGKPGREFVRHFDDCKQKGNELMEIGVRRTGLAEILHDVDEIFEIHEVMKHKSAVAEIFRQTAAGSAGVWDDIGNQ
jgi:hypothetical protein